MIHILRLCTYSLLICFVFQTHPSVRIKGSENVYTPVQCLDDACAIKTPHLHCPFCVKTDSYTDPVILKAHYRVKHVDKGIEFAGNAIRCFPVKLPSATASATKC